MPVDLDKLREDMKYIWHGGERWTAPGQPVQLNGAALTQYSPMADEVAKRQQSMQEAQLQGREISGDEVAGLSDSKNALALLQKQLESQPQRPTTGGVLHSIGNVINPMNGLETLAGIGSVPVALAKGLASNVGNLAQAVSPVDLQQYSDRFPEQHPGIGRSENLLKGVPIVGDLAGSWLNAFRNRLTEDSSYVRGDQFVEPKLRAAAGAAKDVIDNAVAAPLRTILSGEVVDPKDPTKTKPAGARDTAEAATNLALLFLPIKAAAAKLGSLGMPSALEMLEGKQLPEKAFKATKSAGEIRAADIIATTQQRERAAQIAEVRGRTTPTETPLAGATNITEGIPKPKLFTNEEIDSLPAKSEYPVLDQLQASEEFQKLHPEVQKQLSVEMALDHPLYKDLITNIIIDPVRSQAVFDLMKTGDSVYQGMAKVLDDPNLTEVFVPDAIKAYGVSPEQMQTVLAASFERQTHQAGQSLQSVGDLLDQLESKFLATARTGDTIERVEAQKTLDVIRKWRNRDNQPAWFASGGKMANLMDYATQKAQQVERLRIGYMLSQFSTAVHIAKSQGLFALADAFDAFNTGMLRSAGQTFTEGPGAAFKDMNTNFAELGSQYHAARLMLMGKLNSSIEPVFDALPMTKGRLLTGVAADADNTLGFLAGNYQRALGEAKTAFEGAPSGSKFAAGMDALSRANAKIKELGHFPSPIEDPLHNTLPFVYDSAMLATDIATMPLRWQEQYFRKWAFKARLDANLEKIGMNGEDALAQLNRVEFEEAKTSDGKVIYDKATGQPKVGDIKSIDEGLRWAVVDAENHALRQTWAATPDAGVLGRGLQLFRTLNAISPIQSSVIFTPFVKAMANNIMWQAHHSPVGLMDILTKPYQEAWLSPGKTMPMRETVTMQRKIGESMSGLYMLTAAMHLADGGQIGPYSMGPKPWILVTGASKDSQNRDVEVPYDTRNIAPHFSSYLTMGKILYDKLIGRENNVTDLETLDVLANTRIESVPVFNFEEQMRNVSSDNPITAWKALTETAGNYVGPFGNLLRTWREHYKSATLGLPYTIPTQAGSPLSGPILRGASPDSLPEYISPFTGEIRKQLHPTLDLALPFGRPQDMTPIEDLLTRQKGFLPSMITKKYDNPEAQNMVNKETAQLINDPAFRFGDDQFQDLAKKLIALDSPVKTKLVMSIVLPTLHQISELKAMAADSIAAGGGLPPHFIPQLAAKFPNLGLPQLEQAWQSELKKIELLQHPTLGQPQGQP